MRTATTETRTQRGFARQARGLAPKCGFARFLFELPRDYYPAPAKPRSSLASARQRDRLRPRSFEMTGLDDGEASSDRPVAATSSPGISPKVAIVGTVIRGVGVRKLSSPWAGQRRGRPAAQADRRHVPGYDDDGRHVLV